MLTLKAEEKEKNKSPLSNLTMELTNSSSNSTGKPEEEDGEIPEELIGNFLVIGAQVSIYLHYLLESSGVRDLLQN